VGVMLGHYIPPANMPDQPKKEFVQPSPEPYFIYWLFKNRCIMCTKPATEINEIIPRSRSKDSILDWRNRVTLCQSCHREFHQNGVTDEKIYAMKHKRREFLTSMGRVDYV
jgi:hypothetical protein